MHRFILATIASVALAACGPTVVHHPTTAHPADGWHRVTSEIADALAEGDAPDASARDWESCLYREDSTGLTVRCPDGTVHTDPASDTSDVACDTFTSPDRVDCVHGLTGKPARPACPGRVVTIRDDRALRCDVRPPQRLDVQIYLGPPAPLCAAMSGRLTSTVCRGVDY